MNKEKLLHIESEIEKEFDGIKLNEFQEKGLLSVCFIKDKEKIITDVNVIIMGNKIDITEVVIMILKNKETTEFQEIFEAVKEYL